MPLNIPATYYEAAFTHEQAGLLRPAVVTMGLHYLGSDITTDFNTIATRWGGSVVASMADTWVYVEARIRDAVGNVITLAENVAGGTAHTPATPNVAFLVRKITALGGRKQHGRMYLPGVSEQDVDNVGTVIASKITEITSNINGFLATASAANFFWTLLHNGTTAPTPITSYQVETTAATQRRRMRK